MSQRTIGERAIATPVVCLMGPTASGKTDVAVSLMKRFPVEIVSVDSALVYRGMDIGTAKPDAATLARAPHRLIDIRDPEDSYSAGEFVRDARAAIDDIRGAGRIPLLVGGTMMYFRALIEGIAELPEADPAIRAAIDAEAAASGWPALHAELAGVDPEAARRIKPTDSQRLQRAIEVYRVSGRPLSDWQRDAKPPSNDDNFLKFALMPPRPILHQRIEKRLKSMIEKGFIEEIDALMKREGLTSEAPSMRAVGYRQFWAYRAGQDSLAEAEYRALVATRQLAKRQFTWLRSEADLTSVDPLEVDAADAISRDLKVFLG
ncbi:MAG: tRNA (adenosine(37)-N6)-dimethylallyltransferase MiaA [Woeseiaceae bacterium]|nr:tRNA (adenosine(37)-N6)-dimethylallyltransferase MiaA [Woeseiaceae bacterium]